MDSIYLIDSNVFITAKNLYDSFDICPGFWKGVIHHYRNGRIFSLDRVRSELVVEKKTEQLLKWTKNVVPKEFFHSSGIDEVIQSYADIILWVERNSQYFESAKKKFAVGADGWLVAYAQIRNMTVVTSEQPAPSSKRKIKLPDVCNQFGVRWVDTFSMLRSLNIQFDLQKTD